MIDRKLILVPHSSPHHALHSGYSTVIKYITQGDVVQPDTLLPYRIVKRLAGSTNQTFGIYDSRSIQKELSLARTMMRSLRGIAHFLNAERDIRFTTYIKSVLDWKFVGTFHEPPDVIRRSILNVRYLKCLDGAVVVGTNQLDIVRNILGDRPVSFIPHGIDASYFTPGYVDYNPLEVIFVGVHLRDFEMLDRVCEVLFSKYPGFRLHAVLLNSYAHYLPRREYVKVYSGITDDELRDLYRRASFLLLPLKEVTACNAILEALACGLPIVTTDLESNRSYLDANSSFLIPRNSSDSMIEAAIELIENESHNRSMRKAARSRSLDYAWPVIANRLQEFYVKTTNC